MYSWSKIRAVCVILLLLPLVHLVVLVSRETFVMLNQSPETWRDEINDYADLDQRDALPDNPLLVVGGRRAWLWKDLPDHLAPHPVLMRGLSGATLDDITYHYSRLVGFYQPGILVVVPGISEFHLRDDNSVAEFMAVVKRLEDIDEEHRGDKAIYFIAPIRTVLFPSDTQRIDNINAQLSRWAADDNRVTLINPNPALSDAIGRVNPAYFRPDGVNLNESGYARLTMLLEDVLAQDSTGLSEL